MYPPELKLNKVNTSDNEASFLDLPLSISNGFVSFKIYDKRDDFDIVKFPFLDGNGPRRPSYGVYFYQLPRRVACQGCRAPSARIGTGCTDYMVR